MLRDQQFVYSKSLSLTISLTSIIFRYLFIYIIKWIGYTTRTEEYRKIKMLVFSISLFLSGFLVLLTSANFEFTNKYWNGRFSDFNKDWFVNVGSVIQKSFFYLALYPLVELCGFGFLLYLKRCKD